MPIEIKNRFTGEVLFSGEYDGLREAIQIAVRDGAKLTCADLTGADLTGAKLAGADLTRADLTRADLTRADLTRAKLDGAKLTCAKLNFQSHDLLAEILRRAAGDNTEKLKIAGYILICRDKCWKDFAELADHDPLGNWALDELAQWVQDDDDAPEMLKDRARKLAEK